jgi:hypothetical protein
MMLAAISAARLPGSTRWAHRAQFQAAAMALILLAVFVDLDRGTDSYGSLRAGSYFGILFS